MKWTAAADQLLVTLWGKGLTLEGVAEGMTEQGYEVEKNAIAGRRHRLLKKGTVFDERPYRSPQPRAPSATRAIREVKPVDHDEGVEYLKNGPNGCKAILNKRGSDGLAMCCGRLRYNGRPYCETHLKMYCNIAKEK